jgi:hypothetical protein
MDELIKYANEAIKKRPDLKEDILDLVSLCQSEIEDGASVQNEIELCRNDIEELLED